MPLLINYPRFCVEIGFNSNTLLGGSGSNCANLICNHGWSYLLLDAVNENKQINLVKEVLTPSNVVETLEKYHVPLNPGYVSIDIDSIDLHIFREIAGFFRPALISVEYNANFPLSAKVTAGPDWSMWQGNKAFGASLSALIEVGNEFDYELVWVVEPFDAFFISRDIFDGTLKKPLLPMRYYRNKTLINVHSPLLPNQKHTFVDYSKFIKNVNTSLAQKSFCRKYEKYLLKNPEHTFKGRVRLTRIAIRNLQKKINSFLRVS